MKVEELKNFLRLRGLRTYEEVDLSPQNSFQSPECVVHRCGVLISYIMTPDVYTLLLIRKRILILNLMLLHRKKQKSKNSVNIFLG